LEHLQFATQIIGL
jgi:ABC-type multidrug transport system ATPase subunit